MFAIIVFPQVVLVIGLSILVVCTYTTLSPPSPSPAVPGLHGDHVVKEEVTLKDLGLDRRQGMNFLGCVFLGHR